jgi:hypothetical protein
MKAFKLQKPPINQSIRKQIPSCYALEQAVQPRQALKPQKPLQARLAPMSLLPAKLAPVLGPDLTPPCLPQLNMGVYYVACGSQQRLRRKENRRKTVSKLGRPAKYGSREEKAAADVARRRERRLVQRQIDLDRQVKEPILAARQIQL